MGGYLARRALVALAVLITVSMLSFGLLRLSGDLATSLAGESAGADYAEFLRRQYGLDRPLPVQYLDWAGRALTGDLGESFFFRRGVAGLLAERLPVTLLI